KKSQFFDYGIMANRVTAKIFIVSFSYWNSNTNHPHVTMLEIKDLSHCNRSIIATYMSGCKGNALFQISSGMHIMMTHFENTVWLIGLLYTKFQKPLYQHWLYELHAARKLVHRRESIGIFVEWFVTKLNTYKDTPKKYASQEEFWDFGLYEALKNPAFFEEYVNFANYSEPIHNYPLLYEFVECRIYYIVVHQHQIEGLFNKFDLKNQPNMSDETKKAKLTLSTIDIEDTSFSEIDLRLNKIKEKV
ncbi:15712_t:CDS:2, partial [Gigaspora margarita]